MPAPDISAADWVLDVEDTQVASRLGELVLARAQGYADAGHVRTLVTGPDGSVLVGTVAGSGGRAYQSVVRLLERTGPRWSGECSCPVGQDCKHTVAVVLTARSRLRGSAPVPAPGADWASRLDPLVQQPPRAEGGPTHRVAVQVSLSAGRGGHEERQRVTLCPVRPGRSKPWVRQGVGWNDLTNRWSRVAVEPRQRALLAQLAALGRSSGFGYFATSHELPLGEIGAVAWPVLRQLDREGIALVPGPGVTGVELGRGAAHLGIDLVRTQRGGLRLGPGVQVEEAPSSRRELFLIGRPAHGLGWVGEDGVLTLWPVAGVLPAAVLPVLESGQDVQIPAEDVGTFLERYYPALAHQVELTSSDGSVPTPRTCPPRLRLELTPEAGHVLHLRWSFVYTVPGITPEPAQATVAVGEPGTEEPWRDPAAERRAAGAVLPLLEAVPALTAGREPALRGRVTLVGAATARFATEVLPRLEQEEDLEVVVHGDGGLATYAEAAEAPVVHLSSTEAGAGDWFDLHVRVTVDGQEVPFEELFAALSLDQEVLLLESGTWLRLDRPELHGLRRLIEEARELVDPRDRTEQDTVRVSVYQAGLWEELVQTGLVQEQQGRWHEQVAALVALGDGDRGLVLPPPGLDATLRPYQLEGYRWLARLWDAGLGGILADDMGLGKTLQALAMVVRAEHRAELGDGPVLVVAPTSVVGAWAQEAARFAPHLRTVTIGATRRRRGTDLAEAVGGADLVLTTYTLLRLEAEQYRGLPWSAAVLDEAQFAKNHRSATYRALRDLGARRTFAITGTPLENTLMDLWSMTSLAAPGLFPRPEVFTQRYRVPIESGGATDELARLRARVRPFLLRRTKSEVAAELPDKIEQTLQVDLHPAHRRLYDQHLQRERQRILGLLADMDRNRVQIFRALTAMRQLALDPSLLDEAHAGVATSAKITALVEQLTEIAAEGHRALVFSSFTSYLALVRGALREAGLEHAYLDGSTRHRAAVVAGFREGDQPVFLISLKAGGVGLTLTEADYVFVLDPWWNPAAEAQAVDRTHRIGQERTVHVYRMVSTGTIEEKVVALQQRKRELFTSVVDAGEFRSGTVTADDIRDLLDP
ncbi:SNF2-related protein [Serinicoccus sp. LYQ131]|uniref:DEAD/DEAH box helicase n=1 Tax=Serinicoccus sp. LYQ131 TaxID=3378797 RepID=UPI0038542E97